MINKYGFFLTIFTLVSLVSVSQNTNSLSKDELNGLSSYCFCIKGASQLEKNYNDLINKGIRPPVVKKDIPLTRVKILYGIQVTLVNSGIKYYSENDFGYKKSDCDKLLKYINDKKFKIDDSEVNRNLLIFHLLEVARSAISRDDDVDLIKKILDIVEDLQDKSMDPHDFIAAISDLPKEERAYFGF
ncbi:MAG: hypothetical protein RSF68_13015 [Myroides sp.]